MAWENYLLKNESGQELDLEGILKSYRSNPNQQLDVESYRDGDGVLHRDVLPHTASKIWLTTNTLTGEKKDRIQAFFGTNFGEARKKCTLTYWNDEVNGYLSGDFYIPDIDWEIILIKNGERKYSPVEITLIEY